MQKNNTRKKRDNPTRGINDYWTKEKLFDLLQLSESLSQKLYPNIASPLVETEDLVRNSLNNNQEPHYIDAALPYIHWCIHKCPPYKLALNADLARQSLKAYWRSQPDTEVPMVIRPKAEGNLLKNLIDVFNKDINPSSYNTTLPEQTIENLQKVLNFLSEIHLTEDPDPKENHQFELKIENLINDREKELRNNLQEIKQNNLIQYFENETAFTEIFNEFNSFFPLQTGKHSNIAESIIKYRFLLHILILFLQTAGSENNLTYSLECIKEYRKKVYQHKDRFSNARTLNLQSPPHNTLPNKETLKSIKNAAQRLYKHLKGRTFDEYLLVKLADLAYAERDDFTLKQKIPDKTNLSSRAFIQALTIFLCLYHYDFQICYTANITPEADKEQKKKFAHYINNVVFKITDIFYDEITLTYVTSNTADIFSDIQKKIIYDVNFKILNLQATPYLSFTKQQTIIKISNLYKQKLGLKAGDLTEKLDEIIMNSPEFSFWHDLYHYYGEYTNSEGDIKLRNLKSPAYVNNNLDRYVTLMQYMLEEKIKQIKQSKQP